MNKGNQKLYVSEQNKLKHKLENKNKARCQLGKKAMKIKLRREKHSRKSKQRNKCRKNNNKFKKLKKKNRKYFFFFKGKTP